MKKFIVTTFLVVLGAYGAFKGLVWYQTDQAIAKFKEATALHMAVDYGWISSNLEGEIIIKDIKLTPFQLRETIPIQEISLKFPSVFAMLDYYSPLNRRSPHSPNASAPDAFEITVTNANFPTVDTWENYKSPEDGSHNFNDLLAINCGDVEEIEFKELRELGYDRLRVDASWGYRNEPVSANSSIFFNIDIQGMNNIQGQIDFDGALSMPSSEGGKFPRVKYLSYVHQDASFNKRLSSFCTRKTGDSPAQFIQGSVDKTVQRMAEAGITLNQDLIGAYADYLKDGRVFEVIVNPVDELDYSLLAFMDMSSIVDALGLQLRMNQVMIPDLSATIDQTKLKAFLSPPPVVVEAPKPPPPKVEKAYRQVEVEELDAYVGYPVRLKENSGKLIEGSIEKVLEYQIDVAVPLQTGSVSFHIKKRDIAEIKVYK
ncbi:hypothetical protein EUZ85_06815 [Hahella sp. KA22]|uniref:hypothetical protein n=1 Tax=Hahella sp. KA22 TaxID=1628392 RepID=UPI000FDEB615|nr:hypothetical protein [Hahella sp. KA22]AZZ90448.1 hypothetical protein ENC22_04265 [Hahella sp. KA22]QAY53817.1 hypothetical protein EUZ85_06815 [Hahella sp. KA22]